MSNPTDIFLALFSAISDFYGRELFELAFIGYKLDDPRGVRYGIIVTVDVSFR